MTIATFTAYLHDDLERDERIESINGELSARGLTLSATAVERLGRPFYEVALNCTVDTETGAVTILGVTT